MSVLARGALLLILICAAAQAENRFSENGRLEALSLGGGWTPVATDIVVPLKGWTKQFNFSAAKVNQSKTADSRTWRATLSDEAGGIVIEQSVREINGRLVFDVRATAQKDVDCESVLFWIDVPAEKYAGGSFTAGIDFGPLPLELTEQFRLSNASTHSVTLKSKDDFELNVTFPPKAPVTVQDSRKWSNHFSVLVPIHYGPLRAGQSVVSQISLVASGQVDAQPATVMVDPNAAMQTIRGMGGNYCFKIESPITRYTLDNLNVAYARTELSLKDWEPENDDADPAKINWAACVARDTEGSRLRAELELMRELSQKKIPYIASVWHLPGWLTTPVAGAENSKVDASKWPEFAECVTSYLLYAKEKYQAEPELFSFNEPDLGVQVLLSPEEHRDSIKLLGTAFEKSGLKTRLLLGDVANPRGSTEYLASAIADPDALKFAGAISFHSWGGAQPEQYNVWPRLAQSTKLPLIVAEAGVDPAAWKTGSFQSFDYGLREAAQYQDLFRHARPNAILFWEFTDDYPLLTRNKFNKNRFAPTERYCFQKHYCDLIPAGSVMLASTSDNEFIRASVFKFSRDGAEGFTVHLLNTGWAREVTLRGLPASVTTLTAVRTSRGELYRVLEAMKPENGSIKLALPPQCLISLTTLSVEPLKQ
ncbi:MAG TPA: hypothetical protein VEK08_07870 [Planctomycetota bacterium]|nr:hypothetical protein [Planctomycetota bacterium]